MDNSLGVMTKTCDADLRLWPRIQITYLGDYFKFELSLDILYVRSQLSKCLGSVNRGPELIYLRLAVAGIIYIYIL